jgi:DNA-binding beta-propeller fold protein YncE
VRCLVLAAAVLLALPASAPARRDGGTLLALVADARGRLLAVDVGGSERSEVRIPAGPARLAATAAPRVAVVVSAQARLVTIVDVRAMRAVAVVRGFGAPCDVALASGADYAYVTDEARGRIAVLDLHAGRVVARVAVGGRPCRLAVTDDAIWLADASGDARLTVLDARDPRRPRPSGRVDAGGPVSRLTLAQRPSLGELSVGRRRHIWITYRRSGVLGMLDTEVRRLVFRRRIGATLGALAVDPSERHGWVVDDATGLVLVVNAATGRVLRSLPVGRGVSGIAALVGRAVLVKRDGTIAAYYREPAAWLGRPWTSRRLGGRPTAVALAFS